MHREGFGEWVGSAEGGRGASGKGEGQGPWRPALTPGQAVTGTSSLWVKEGDLRKACKRFSIYPTCTC